MTLLILKDNLVPEVISEKIIISIPLVSEFFRQEKLLCPKLFNHTILVRPHHELECSMSKRKYEKKSFSVRLRVYNKGHSLVLYKRYINFERTQVTLCLTVDLVNPIFIKVFPVFRGIRCPTLS